MATQAVLILSAICVLLMMTFAMAKVLVKRVLSARVGEDAANKGAEMVRSLAVMLSFSLICAAVLFGAPQFIGPEAMLSLR